jgi:hypothetical protein
MPVGCQKSIVAVTSIAARKPPRTSPNGFVNDLVATKPTVISPWSGSAEMRWNPSVDAAGGIGARPWMASQNRPDRCCIAVTFQLVPASAWRLADEMMEFWLANRLRAVVVLARSEGTRYEGVARRFADLSVETLVDALPPGAVSDADRGLLDSIFVNTAQTIARILERNTTEESIQSTITNFWRYQLAGLAALLRHLADQADGPGDAM